MSAYLYKSKGDFHVFNILKIKKTLVFYFS